MSDGADVRAAAGAERGEVRDGGDGRPGDRSAARKAPLALDGETFRSLGHELVERIAELLEALPSRRVSPGASPEAVRAALRSGEGLPERGREAAEVLREATDLLLEHSLYNGHPRFYGYITSSPAPIGMLGDLLAAAVNPNVGGWSLSPMATEIEEQTVRWIADLLGFPAGGGGLLVSGGNMANFVAFLAARTATADWPVRERGLVAEGAGRLRVYVSRETHTWVQKAADLFGLGTDAIRWIPVDGDLRMDVGALRRAVEADRAAGNAPMMVVGTAGTVSTGAVDPLPALARTCRETGVWFHVDGAYGAFAAALPHAHPDLAGIAEADSVAVDPHKWLYAPLEAGCVLVRDRETLRGAFSYHPPYYRFGVEATNFVDLGPQNSRGFRALKVWLALRQVGREGYRRMIGEDIALARRLFEAAEERPELETGPRGLSITTFRYVPEDLRERRDEPEVAEYLNDLNGTLQDRLEQGGGAFMSNAVVDGRYLLRACIVNFNTGPEDVDALPALVVETGRRADAELRPDGLRS